MPRPRQAKIYLEAARRQGSAESDWRCFKRCAMSSSIGGGGERHSKGIISFRKGALFFIFFDRGAYINSTKGRLCHGTMASLSLRLRQLPRGLLLWLLLIPSLYSCFMCFSFSVVFINLMHLFCYN